MTSATLALRRIKPLSRVSRAAREILSETSRSWLEHDASSMGAALAYYTMFSLAPILVILIAILGFVYGDESSAKVFDQFSRLVGPDGARFLQITIQNAKTSESGAWATVTSVAILALGASAVFSQLQSSLNKIWNVKPNPNFGWKEYVIQRALSFTIVLAIGAVLLISLIASAVVNAVESRLSSHLPWIERLSGVTDFGISFLVITTLFAIMFKALPDVELSWKYVSIGALFTAFLFVIGKYLIGIYLGQSSIGSAYGAAGSLAMILAWVYYSSQVFFFGAEFTRVFSERQGLKAKPKPRGIEGGGTPPAEAGVQK